MKELPLPRDASSKVQCRNLTIKTVDARVIDRVFDIESGAKVHALEIFQLALLVNRRNAISVIYGRLAHKSMEPDAGSV